MVETLSPKREMFKHYPTAPQVTIIKSQTLDPFRAFASTQEDKTSGGDGATAAAGDISSRRISRTSRENWVYAKKKTYGYLEPDKSKR